MRNGTLLDHVGDSGSPSGCAVLISVNDAAGLTMDHSTISNAPGDGVCVGSRVSQAAMVPIVLTQSTITRVAGAALTDQTFGAVANVTVDGLSLVGNGRGIDWSISAADVGLDLRNLTVSGSTSTTNAAVRVVMGSGGSFKLRGGTIVGNSADGLLLSVVTSTSVVDLGSSADPGGNTFTGNGDDGLHIDGFGSAATVNAIGNLWLAGQQGADANGRYSTQPGYVPVPKTGPASGANFTIDNAVTTLGAVTPRHALSFARTALRRSKKVTMKRSSLALCLVVASATWQATPAATMPPDACSLLTEARAAQLLGGPVSETDHSQTAATDENGGDRKARAAAFQRAIGSKAPRRPRREASSSSCIPCTTPAPHAGSTAACSRW